MKIRKGDNIKVLAGKDRGKTAKVLRALPAEGRVVIDGVNIRKRHVRPRRSGQKGETVQFPAAMHISNVQLMCGACGKAVRAGCRTGGDKKERVCKKCGAVV